MCSNQLNRRIDEMYTSDSTNLTMLANENFDAILDQVKNSCLNFQIQVSPFSALISLKKSFVKDKSGNLLLPSNRHVTSKDTGELIDKNSKLEHDIMVLTKKHNEVVGDLEKTLQEARVKQDKVAEQNEREQQLKAEIETMKNTLKNRDSEIRNLKAAIKKSNDVSEKLNKKLHENRANYEHEKDQILKEHARVLKSLKKDVLDVQEENRKLKKQCVLKDDELKEAFDQKVMQEEKITSLLDVLYGCPECGLNSCECDNSVNEDDYAENSSSTQPSTLPSFPPPISSALAQLLPRPSSDVSTWTPPPTPPCTSCGGVNFGPSPADLCFKCISPLRNKSPHNSSSHTGTPPGTPPALRLESVISRNQNREDLCITPACDQEQKI